MKIAIVGGGPAGMYFALLMKKRDANHDITVYEQNPAGATYGWGVVFSDVALSFLKQADEAFYKKFTASHERCDYMEVVHQDVHVQLRNNHFSRASRIDLLSVLQDECKAAGVQFKFDTRIDDIAALDTADLIVGADGANSGVRTQLAEHFKPQFEKRRNKFAWYGTRQLFHAVSLIFRETECGVFIAHCYQYSKDLSTFLIEVDPDTWKRAGLDTMSDEDSQRFCEQVFEKDLGSNGLLSNRSTWFSANIVSNENWSYTNVVLLGDALRTVHFSLGSGTRMAMQDAIALYEAVNLHGQDLPAAFKHFETLRRTSSANFQTAAAKSLDWYESVDRKMHLDPVVFAYDYMRRTGRVSHEDLKERDPGFISRYEALTGEAVS
ncbi:MAG TPA: monooxygenase [Pusillimonas sp.]|jgi:2-polyprenyl-6-methoxyphenol hydroxylase-like FAD-dependent oxidoreductase|nr:monooxygenase [Pusillimonas sp.]HCN70770.1 monooxygenase [Pusillimonas sp.]|tara:strand:- start:58503 stop:59642 length:1140 start_codon:yes stop_codon:yes gene_type:complete